MRIKVVFLVTFLTCGLLSAQELPVYSTYYANPFLYNPGYAGNEGGPVFAVNYRQQWLGIVDGPATATFTFHTPLKFGLRLGILAYRDQLGIVASNNGQLTLGYGMKLGEETFVSLGMSGGVLNNTFDLSEVDPSNPAIANLPQNNLSIDGRVGMWLKLKGLQVGASLPNIFETNLVDLENFNNLQVSPLDNYMVYAAYRYAIKERNKTMVSFEPNVLFYQPLQNLSPVVTGMLNIGLRDIVTVGGGYRTSGGFIGNVGFSYSVIRVNYAFDAASASLGGFSNTTHEVHFAISFGDNPQKTEKQQVSDYIQKRAEAAARAREEQLRLQQERRDSIARAEALALEQAQAEAERQRQLEAERKRQEEARLEAQRLEAERQERERQQAEAERLRQQQLEQQQQADQLRQQEQEAERLRQEQLERERQERERLAREREEQARMERMRQEQERLEQERKRREAEIVRNQIQTEKQTVVEEEVVNENETVKGYADDDFVKIDPTYTESVQTTVQKNDSNPVNMPTADTAPPVTSADATTVSARKGSHYLELDIGAYVIVGAFSSQQNAENYSDELFEKGYFTKYGYNSDKGYYYVYLYNSPNPDAARKERDRQRKRGTFDKAWVLIIE